MNKIFLAEWQSTAAQSNLYPTENECLGWKVHPTIGGMFQVNNLQIFDMVVYQRLMGQLHRQLQRPS
jgi:hypothetical protein